MPTLPWRVQQSTSTTGTGTLALNTVAAGRRSFQDAYGTGVSRVPYVISGSSFFEIGYGDFDGGSPGTLSRVTVLASSNAGALVSLPAGTADVFPFIDPSERKMVSGSGNVTVALADIGNAVVWTGSTTATVSIPGLASVPEGRGMRVRNAGTAALTVAAAGADTINGSGTLVLAPTQAVEILRVGSAWAGFWEGGRLVGEFVFGAFASLPPRCIWPAGQAISRATYAALFAVYGTTHGAGDGSTTFNVPDLRGRAVFGKDDMGGTAASRITSAVSGFAGNTLGAVGGDQRAQQHNHAITDPGHGHGVTDPGHHHNMSPSAVNYTIGGTGNSELNASWTGTSGNSTSTVTTGISVGSATTGISVNNNLSGLSQNMPPGFIGSIVIYTGVG